MEHHEEYEYDWDSEEVYPQDLTPRERDWIKYFRNIAEVISIKSKDRSTKIGAVIVDNDNAILSTGYNSFPRGIKDNVEERHERPEKYLWTEHGERNAIYNAARKGIRIEGARMFLNCRVSCPDCARAIINAGIREVWFDRDQGAKGAQWTDEMRSKVSVMFEEAGVDTYFYDEIL